jgi:hypothetical protein
MMIPVFNLHFWILAPPLTNELWPVASLSVAEGSHESHQHWSYTVLPSQKVLNTDTNSQSLASAACLACWLLLLAVEAAGSSGCNLLLLLTVVVLPASQEPSD